MSSRNILYISGRKKITQLKDESKNEMLSEIDLSNSPLKDTKIKFILSGIYHNFIVTENDDIYTFGQNHFGQLGLGDKLDRPSLTLLQNEDLKGKMITGISGRACFVGLVADASEVYLFGLNNFGQLGQNNTDNLDKPTRVLLPSSGLLSEKSKEIHQLCCAGVHSVVITKDQRIFVTGYNSYGQLGNGTTDDAFLPFQLKVEQFKNKKISRVVCGDYHTIFIMENGEIWACGKNVQGQCGLNDKESRKTPEEITFFRNKNITHISCGENHTIVVVDSKDVYGFGTNNNGQLGLGNGIKYVSMPTRIPIPLIDSIKILKCGRNFTIIVSEADEIYVFGDNISDQLGYDRASDQRYIMTPTLMPFPEHPNRSITHVACGEYHCLFLVSDMASNILKIDCLRHILMSQEFEHHHLFDGIIKAKGKEFSVCHGLIRQRFPSLYESDQNERVFNVSLSADCFSVLLQFIYTDELNSPSGNTSIELFVWLSKRIESHPLKRLKSLLHAHIVKLTEDKTVASMLYYLNSLTKENLDIRKHFLAYLKKCMDANRFVDIPYNDLLSAELLREVIAFGGKHSVHRISEIPKYKSTIEDDMIALFEKNVGDLRIVIGPNRESVWVYKCLFAFGVQKFLAQFTSGMQDQEVEEISLYDEFTSDENLTNKDSKILSSVLRQFLRFVYCGKLEVSPENAISLLCIWDRLAMPESHSIVKICIRVILSGIDRSNALSILSILSSKGLEYEVLENKCVQTLAKHWEIILMEYSTDQLTRAISFEQYDKITRQYVRYKTAARPTEEMGNEIHCKKTKF